MPCKCLRFGSCLQPVITCCPMGCTGCSRGPLLQVMEKALLDAQHGAARLASEAAGPVHLHTQPPPQQPLRLARTCYPALLSRVQLDLAASRMSTFDAPEDSDHEQPESSDPDGPTGDAGPGERQGQQPGCRVCRSARHTTRRCPVVWLTGRSDASSEQIQAPAQRDGQEGRSEECPWLAHVPDSVKDLMDAMQQYATDAVQRGAYDGSARAVRGQRDSSHASNVRRSLNVEFPHPRGRACCERIR